MLLSVYNLLMRCLVFVYWLYYRKQAFVLERLGYHHLPTTSAIWFNASGLGEVQIALWCIDYYQLQTPIILTTSTHISKSHLQKLIGHRNIHPVYMPLDSPSACRRFFKNLTLQKGYFIESELWPNLIHTAKQHGIELHYLNAKISPKSTRRYRYFASYFQNLLNQFSTITASHESYYEAFISFQPKCQVQHTLNLKWALPQPSYQAIHQAKLQQQLHHNGIHHFHLIVSSQFQEDIDFINHIQHLNTPLVIIPRHLNRVPILIRHLELLGYSYCFDTQLKPKPQCIIVNSYGQVGLWLSLTQQFTIGGSFVKGIGGHNPLEGLKMGKQVGVGPYGYNALLLLTQAPLGSYQSLSNLTHWTQWVNNPTPLVKTTTPNLTPLYTHYQSIIQ